MNLFELRKRLSPSNFIRRSAPVLLGASLLVSSSCSNVREFAGRSKGEGAKSEAVADKAGVEHAYTANKKEDDFVKLLEHKMRNPQITKSAPKVTASEPSVQELLAAGKDPFVDDAANGFCELDRKPRAGPTRTVNHVSGKHNDAWNRQPLVQQSPHTAVKDVACNPVVQQVLSLPPCCVQVTKIPGGSIVRLLIIICGYIDPAQIQANFTERGKVPVGLFRTGAGSSQPFQIGQTLRSNFVGHTLGFQWMIQ